MVEGQVGVPRRQRAATSSRAAELKLAADALPRAYRAELADATAAMPDEFKIYTTQRHVTAHGECHLNGGMVRPPSEVAQG